MDYPYLNAYVLFGLVLLAGCASQIGSSLFPMGDTGATSSSVAPEKVDACSTPEACGMRLKKIIKDPKRDWVGQLQTPDVYANGTRLFSYRALRKKLSCGELDAALNEFKQAAPSLQAGHYERVRVLLTTVNRELRTERNKRCAAHAPQNDPAGSSTSSRSRG